MLLCNYRFYSSNSSFVHGGLDAVNEGRDGGGKHSMEPVHGQQEIHQRIMQLNFRDCKAKIRQVDAHATLGSGVVVQVKIQGASNRVENNLYDSLQLNLLHINLYKFTISIYIPFSVHTLELFTFRHFLPSMK